MRLFPVAAAALAFVCGCATAVSVDRFVFADEDGNSIEVEYCVLSKEYSYKLVSPMNGREIEGHDNKIARITLPDGRKITCRICQNDVPKGTMYATEDFEWKYLTIGFTSRIYRMVPERQDYILMFEGDVVFDNSGGGSW